MTRWVDGVARSIATAGIPRLLPPRGPLIVMYHGIGGVDGVAPEAFSAQLDLILARRRIVPLADLSHRLEDPTAVDLAAITFDDGYVDFSEIAHPILARKGIHATLFVPAGRLGQTNDWDAGHMAERRILDAEALRRLDSTQVEIGSHGFSHRRIVDLDESALETETLGSRRVLEDVVDRPVRLFAYPYGQRDDFDRAAERAVERAGFELACSTCFGRSSREYERFRLRRVGIEPDDDLEVVDAKLAGAFDWVAVKERVGYGLRALRRRGYRISRRSGGVE